MTKPSEKTRKYLSSTPPDAPPPTKSATDCAANGCLLPGVFGMAGSSSSLCCVHDEQHASKWGEQTMRARNRIRLFDLALRMTNAAPGTVLTDELIERITSLDGPAPKGGEGEQMTVRRYGQQLKGALIAECRGPRDSAPDIVPAPRSGRVGESLPSFEP